MRSHIFLLFCFVLVSLFYFPGVHADFAQISSPNVSGYRDGDVNDDATLVSSTGTSFRVGDASNLDYYGFIDFNTTGYESVTITNVWLQLALAATGADQGSINVRMMEDVSTNLIDSEVLSECQSSNLAATGSTAFNGASTNTPINISLGAVARTFFEANASQHFFSVCLNTTSSSLNGRAIFHSNESTTAAYRPVLWINYTSSSLFSSQANLTLNGVAGNISIAYTQNVTAIASGYNVSGGTLYRNGTNVTSQNGTSIRLAAGQHNYTFITEGNATHYGSNVSYFVNISQALPPITLVYGSLEKNFSTATAVRGSTCPDELVCLLYRNNTQVANVTLSYTDPDFLGVGTYEYVFNTTGNENYTSHSVTENITINPIAAPITLTIGGTAGNVSLTTGEITIVGTNSTTVNGTGYVFDTALYINNNRTSLSTTQTYEVGTYNLTLNTSGVSGNFTDNSINYTLTVTAAPLPNGGGGSSSRYNPPAQEDQECKEDWACEGWSACQNGVRTRNCFESNSCGTSDNKPQESSSCTVEIPLEEEEPIIQAVEPNVFGEDYDNGKGDGLSSIVEIECANGDECRDFDEIIAKWGRLNISDKVSFNKEVVYDEATNTTRAKLFVEANEDLEDFKYYQSIPSCMALYAKLVNFTTPPTTILNEDPLMVWEFDAVTQGEVLDFSFEVAGEISEDCLSFLKEVFYEDAPLEGSLEKPIFKNWYFWLSILVILGIVAGVSYVVIPKSNIKKQKKS